MKGNRDRLTHKARGPFTVIVRDNFHYGDSDEEWILGDFETAEAAVLVAKQFVDNSLKECAAPGRTAAEIYGCYKAFGDDPWVASVGAAQSVEFSAWDYAREKARELAA